MTKQKVLGSFEVTDFPELSVSGTIAKIDTGAYSGALHATGMREIKTAEGKKALEFYPLGKKQHKTVVAGYSRKPVKSSNGQLEMRYVIKTTVVIQGETYPIAISLSDRSAMMKYVLIGRQFLRRHRFLVDVRKGMKFRYIVKDKQ